MGRQYTSGTTFTDVRERLEDAFDELQPRTVQGCIDKANSHLKLLFRQVQEAEQDEEQFHQERGEQSVAEGSISENESSNSGDDSSSVSEADGDDYGDDE